LNLILAICPGLCLYVRSYPQKFQDFFSFGLAWPSIFAFTKEFPKNTKENLPSDHFCSHLWQDGQIDLLSSPDCHICIGVSANTHNGHLGCHNGHMPVWLFDAIMAIWPYSHMAIMALNVYNMENFGNSDKNVAIW
jgi:hypothetical protein